ncbi:MAG: hypothetical protein ACOY71_12275 [Gemmatimonadota bacterium]
MLTALEVQKRRRPGSPPSLKQQYQDYLMQRIEAYKNSLPRDELLRLGDEASVELQAASEEQFVLTEVMMMETVDRLIMKRLRLKSYRRWKEQHQKLRQAQRDPVHWGLDPRSPIAALLPRLEPADSTLVVGAGAKPVAFLLAAYDVWVSFLDNDLGSVERLETDMTAESLASRFSAWVVDFSRCYVPADIPQPVHLTVIDAATLTALEPPARALLVARLQAISAPDAVHVILPAEPALAPESFIGLYEGWNRETVSTKGQRGAPAQAGGVVFSHPPCQTDTPDAGEGVAGGHDQDLGLSVGL